MKKLISICTALLLSLLSIFYINHIIDEKIDDNRKALSSSFSAQKSSSKEVMKKISSGKSVVIMGSSELGTSDTGELEEFFPSAFFESQGINVVLTGAGYWQSLLQAQSLAAISDSLKESEVFLLVSPQWFIPGGIPSDAYASRFSEDLFYGFMTNPHVSNESKEYVLSRNKDLLSQAPNLLNRVEKMDKAYNESDLLSYSYIKSYGTFNSFKQKYQTVKKIDSGKIKTYPYTYDRTYDFKAELLLAEERGKEHCTNNDLGIKDDYWDTYVADEYKQGEIILKSEVNTESAEFNDLDCFMTVAKELNIKVSVVCIPVNAYWYDYSGQQFNAYYQKLRSVVEAQNVNFIDFSKYQYEKYFFKDIMHLGWKGWVRVNDAILQEINKQ